MATLWIRQYTRGAGLSYNLPIAREPGTDLTPVSFTGTAGQSAVFAAGTKYISIISDAAFHYLVASNPTATTNHLKVPADTIHSFAVTPGQKISAIAAA